MYVFALDVLTAKTHLLCESEKLCFYSTLIVMMTELDLLNA